MTTHKRALLTVDCDRHAAADTVPCWCGAGAKPRGLVLSALPWTPGSIAGLIEWLGTADRATLPRISRNLSGLLEALPPETIAPCDLSEADLLAAWTAGDETARETLTAELERRDAADAFAREPAYAGRTVERHDVDAEYSAYLHSQYLAACDATHSYMVSAAGVRHGYRSSDFFKVGRRPSVEKWGSDELRAWLGSVNAAAGSVTAMGEVLSKTEYTRLTSDHRELVAA